MISYKEIMIKIVLLDFLFLDMIGFFFFFLKKYIYDFFFAE